MPRKATRDRGLRRGEGYTTKRTARDGKVTWQARWPDGGRWRAKGGFPDELAAEDYCRQMTRAHRSGRYVPPQEMTVEDVVNQYILRRQQRWKTSTYSLHRKWATRRIIPDLGTIRIVDLTRSRIQHWIDSLPALPLAQGSISVVVGILLSALRDAHDLETIETNPARKIKRPVQPMPQHITWSREEVTRVLDAVATDAMHNAFYLVIIMTGMRPGETLALQWRDIDLDRVDEDGDPAPSIMVQRTVTRDARDRFVIGTSTKTGKPRSVSIPPEVVTALRGWRREQAAIRLRATTWDDRSFCFTNRRGTFITPPVALVWHDRMCARVGVIRITLHEMRHTHATLELHAGTNDKIVSERLGHSVQTLINHYSHTSPGLHRQSSNAFAAMIKGERTRQHQGRKRSQTPRQGTNSRTNSRTAVKKGA